MTQNRKHDRKDRHRVPGVVGSRSYFPSPAPSSGPSCNQCDLGIPSGTKFTTEQRAASQLLGTAAGVHLWDIGYISSSETNAAEGEAKYASFLHVTCRLASWADRRQPRVARSCTQRETVLAEGMCACKDIKLVH